MNDLFETSSGLVRRFISKELHPRLHLDCLLERIKNIDSTLHAFIAVYAEAARADADAAERALQRGYPLGPLTVDRGTVRSQRYCGRCRSGNHWRL